MMKNKERPFFNRGKSAPCFQVPKKGKTKRILQSDDFNSTSCCVPSGHRCNKRKSCQTHCSNCPSNDNRGRAVLHTRHQSPSTGCGSCHRHASMSPRSYGTGSIAKSPSRIRWSSDQRTRGTSCPYFDSQKLTGEGLPRRLPAQGFAQKLPVQSFIPHLPRQSYSPSKSMDDVNFRPFINASKYDMRSKMSEKPHETGEVSKVIGENHGFNDFLSGIGETKDWSASNHRSDYTPARRSWNTIMSEFSKPHSRIDDMKCSRYETGDATFGDFKIKTSTTAMKSTALPSSYKYPQYGNVRSPPVFLSRDIRSTSNNAFMTNVTQHGNYGGDKSSNGLGGLLNENASDLRSNGLLYTPSYGRKSATEQHNLNRRSHSIDDIDYFVKSLKNITNSSNEKGYESNFLQGLTSEFGWGTSSYSGLLSTHKLGNSVASKPFNDISKASRMTDYSSNHTSRLTGLKTYSECINKDNYRPFYKPFSNYMSSHLHSEKERLNKITSMIGKSAFQ